MRGRRIECVQCIECLYTKDVSKIIRTVNLTAATSNETKQMINNVSRHCANIVGLVKVCNMSINLKSHVSLKDVTTRKRLYFRIFTNIVRYSRKLILRNQSSRIALVIIESRGLTLLFLYGSPRNSLIFLWGWILRTACYEFNV